MWMFLNWALGLRAAGCRVIWLESVLAETPTATLLADSRMLVQRLSDYGFEGSLVVVYRDGSPVRTSCSTLPVEAALNADLFVNLGYDLAPSFVHRFRRTVFVDIDPGLTQIWMSQGSLSIAEHDIYFSYGENIGTRESIVPTCGIEWHFTPPPVFLPEWPICAAGSRARYTTVSSWWDPLAWIPINGTYVDNSKRSAFLEFVDLPTQVAPKFELAIPIDNNEPDEQDRRLFERHRWSIKRAQEVSASPRDYRRYVQQSRGEFSCMRKGYGLLRTGWTGERAINYLASGKPVLLQDTGPSRFVPENEGVLRFRDLKEAARRCRELETDYERHCKSARWIAEEFFDAGRVIRAFLQRALV